MISPQPVQINSLTNESRYEAYKQLRQDQPVYYDEDSEAWLISTHKDVMQAARDPRLITSKLLTHKDTSSFDAEQQRLIGQIVATLSQWMIYNDEQEHRSRREWLLPSMSTKHISASQASFYTYARTMFQEFYDRGEPADLASLVCHRLPATVLATQLGLNPEAAGVFMTNSEMLARFMQDFVVTAVPSTMLLSRALQALDTLRSVFEASLKDAIARGHSDGPLMQYIADACRAGKIDQSLAIHQLVHIVFGGHKVPEYMLTNSIYALITHREALLSVAQNRRMMRSVLDESMRYYSPIQFITRIASTDLQIGTQTICKGDSVYLLLGSANRDETVFPNADSFMLTRDHTQLLSFGSGAHKCIARIFAITELQTALDAFFDVFEDRLPALSVESVCWGENPTFTGINNMVLHF